MIIHSIRFDYLSGRQQQGNIAISVTLREDSINTDEFCTWCRRHGMVSSQDVAYSKTDKWLIRRVWLRTPQQQMLFKLTWHTGEPAWPKEHA